MADKMITPLFLAKYLKAHISGAQLHLVQEAAHFPPNEQPEEVLGYTREWLKQI
jgi:pimeloyl-ACP methyl ester carboxylesterase